MIDLHITGDEAADALLPSDPFALLVGMLLDQSLSHGLGAAWKRR